MSLFAPGSRLGGDNSASVIDQIMQEKNKQPDQEPESISEQLFFESLGDDLLLEAVGKMATQNLRSNAASAVLTWVEDEDVSYEELDSLIYGLASGGDNEELDDDELDQYNTMWQYAFDFLVSHGADGDKVQSMEDNADAAEVVFNSVKESIKAEDDSELVADFAVRESMMMEATKKVIRDGKVTFIKKRTKKYRQTPAQKAALKKARKKANSAAAKANRRKSMRARKSRGMD